jgi:3-hydroxyisobutyrate dehydrogenase-like beta-hydroxyacid dehydrogenase
MRKTAVIGLGAFGLAVGRGLHGRIAGQLIGIDTDPFRRLEWQALTNEETADSAAGLNWTSIDRIFVIVNNETQAAQVLGALQAQSDMAGAAGADHPVYAYVVSTVSPEFSRGLDRYGREGLRMVEMPMTGGEAAALEGTLTAMAAGPLSETETAFLQDNLVSRLVIFDKYGDPAYAKLLNNAVIAYQVAALDEIMQLAFKRGIDPNAMLEVIQNGSAYNHVSTAIHRWNEQLLAKDMALLGKTIQSFPAVSGSADQVEEHFLRLRSLLRGE